MFTSGTRPQRPSWLRSRLARWPLLAYGCGLGRLVGGRVLVLTSKGRVTGIPRRTPLWYVAERDMVHCMSGWGKTSDWYQNIQARHEITVEIGGKRWSTKAEVIHDQVEHLRVLSLVQSKYGLTATRIFYHLDLVALVTFPLDLEEGERVG